MKQISFDNALKFRKPVKKKLPQSDLLDAIVKSDVNFLNDALGDFGLRLARFSHNVDRTHPDITKIFNGCFHNQSNFSVKILEMLDLFSYSKSKNFKISPDLLKKAALSRLSANIKKIDSPFKNQQLVRFLKDKEQRENVRATKKPREISLAATIKKGKLYWEQHVDSFEFYFKSSKVYLNELQKGQQVAKHCEDLGCSFLADEINSNIKEFKQNMKKSCYGFKRITISAAAVILAKTKNYVWNDRSSTINKIDDGKIINYKAYIVPVVGKTNDKMDKLLAHLEKYPQSQEKPVFDHFMLLIDQDEYGKLASEHSNILTHADDGILIGERDGKCYFISYWIK